MGVHCQIYLFKPTDGAYLTGSTVSGIIKYGVDEETVFDKIIVSLKGYGHLTVRDERKRRNNNNNSIDTYRRREDYIDIDTIVNNNGQMPHAIGMYETRFDFKLPENIPSSLDYFSRDSRYTVKCNIVYYIRIKFERPGFFQFAKRFRKELTVISCLQPKLLNEPIMYGQQKKLFQLFSRKNSTVNIKANVRNPVISPGGMINLDYEVCNDTNLTLKGVEIKLVEIYTFTIVDGRQINMSSDIYNTQIKTSPIQSNEKQTLDLVIVAPAETNKSTLGFSNIVSRDYFVKLKTELPFPHIDVVLKMPIEIGELIQETQISQGPPPEIGFGEGPSHYNNRPPDYNNPLPHYNNPLPDYSNPPPSYWEVMGEDDGTKDDSYGEKF